MANPWARSEETFARTQIRHYYLKRLASVAFWKKALAGRLRIGASSPEFMRSAMRAVTTAPQRSDYRQRMLSSLQDFDGPTLLFISGRDLTSQEFLQFARAEPSWITVSKRGLEEVTLPEAVHTFASRPDKQQVERISANWLKRVADAMEARAVTTPRATDTPHHRSRTACAPSTPDLSR